MKRDFSWLLALCALVACGPVTYHEGMPFNGGDVAHTIDATIAEDLKTQHPRLSISPAQCDQTVYASDDQPGHCSLPVDGVAIPVAVSPQGTPEPVQGQIGIVRVPLSKSMFRVSFDGSLYYMPQIARMLEGDLQSHYGVHAVGDCGEPAVRVYRPGAYFYCRVREVPGVTSIKFRALAKNEFYEFNPPHLKPITEEAWLTNALHAHKLGHRVSVRGRDVAAFIDDSLAEELKAFEGRAPAVGKARCPEALDLTASRRAQCVLAFAGSDARYDVSLDNRAGITFRRLDAVLDRELLQAHIQRDVNERLAESGYPADALVGCGSGFVVVRPPGKVYCVAKWTGYHSRIEYDVVDGLGMGRWRGVDVKPDASAQP